METSEAGIFTCIITGLYTKPKHVAWKINNTTVTQKYTTVGVFREADGTFSALVLFYPTPGPDLRSDDVYRCEVEQEGIIHYEEVQPSDCEASL